jgi:hypothetical protein
MNVIDRLEMIFLSAADNPFLLSQIIILQEIFPVTAADITIQNYTQNLS